MHPLTFFFFFQPVVNMPNLQVLSITWNKLSGLIPTNLSGAMPVLSEMWLSNNELTGIIPEDLCQTCTDIDLSWNRFHALPQIGNLRVVSTYFKPCQALGVLSKFDSRKLDHAVPRLELAPWAFTSFNRKIPRLDSSQSCQQFFCWVSSG